MPSDKVKGGNEADKKCLDPGSAVGYKLMIYMTLLIVGDLKRNQSTSDQRSRDSSGSICRATFLIFRNILLLLFVQNLNPTFS